MADGAPGVVIVGAGVIGCVCAYELAKAGCRVDVVERGELCREASWASAGMVAQALPADDALGAFHALGSRMFPALAAEISDLTGVDATYRMNGGFRLCADEAEWPEWEALNSACQAAGVPCELLSAQEVVARDPVLSPHIAGGLWLPEDGVVAPRRYTQTLALAAMRRGARFHLHQPVIGFERAGDRVTGVCTTTDSYTAEVVLLAAGAWTREVGAELGVILPMKPAKGQMIQLAPREPILRHTTHCGDFYLTARPDGTILIGSTVEFVGFDRAVTPGGVKHLLDQALTVAPGLRDIPLAETWAGFRPYAERPEPYLGWLPGVEGVFVAAGHFRTGISPSPITGRLVAEAVTGRETTLSLEPFALPAQQRA